MTAQLCTHCDLRPAVAAVRRDPPDGPLLDAFLCEGCLAGVAPLAWNGHLDPSASSEADRDLHRPGG